MSRCISGRKQVIKFATTRNRGRVCLSPEILNLQNVQFKFRQVLTSLFLAVRTSAVATALKKITTIKSSHNLPLLSLR